MWKTNVEIKKFLCIYICFGCAFEFWLLAVYGHLALINDNDYACFFCCCIFWKK